MNHTGLYSTLESFTQLPRKPEYDEIPGAKSFRKQIENRGSAGLRRELTIILNGLRVPPGANILEVGPGACNYGIELSMRGYNYHGYDMVARNIDMWKAIKKQYGLRGEVVLKDICEVEPGEKDEYFDGVFAVSTFEHIHDQMLALRNCHRLLKPGGRLVVFDGNMLDPRLLYKMTFQRKDGGIFWLFNKNRIYDDYGMGWKGKCEDVKSIYWWKRNLSKTGFKTEYLSTTSASRGWARKLGVWPFLGGVVAVAVKT